MPTRAFGRPCQTMSTLQSSAAASIMLVALSGVSSVPTSQTRSYTPALQAKLDFKAPADPSTVPMMLMVAPELANSTWTPESIFDEDAFNDFAFDYAMAHPDDILVVMPNASNTTAQDIISAYMSFGDGSNLSVSICEEVAAAIPTAGLNFAATVMQPFAIGNTYHAFGESLGSLFVNVSASLQRTASLTAGGVTDAIHNITRYDSSAGIHHAMAWQMVMGMLEKPTLEGLLNICPEDLGAHANCWHGAGHGVVLRESPNRLNGPCEAKKMITNMSGTELALQLCRDASQGAAPHPYRGWSCSDGVYHSFWEFFDHSAYWDKQANHEEEWAYPCDQTWTSVSHNCFRWLFYAGAPYYNWDMRYFFTDATSHVSSMCLDSGMPEVKVLACIVGASSVWFNIYDWTVLTPNSTVWDSCSTHPAYPRVGAVGFEVASGESWYCDVLLRNQNGNSSSIEGPGHSGSTLVDWCSYFVEPSVTPRYLSDEETLRWYSCVLGAQHRVREDQERLDLGEEMDLSDSTTAELFEHFKMLRLYDCKPLLEVPWQLDHTMRQEAFRLCATLFAADQEVPWLEFSSAPYQRPISALVSDEDMQLESLLRQAESLVREGQGALLFSP